MERFQELLRYLTDHKPSDSLTNGLAAPRRCSVCQKKLYFKAYKCKHCRHRCHKKCAAQGHHSTSGSAASSRRNSTHKAYTGEEHWTKVLQANEVNSNLVGWQCNGSKSFNSSMCRCDRSKRKGSTKNGKPSSSKDTNIFHSLYSRFCDWVASQKKESLLGRRVSVGLRSRSGSSSGSGLRGHQDLVSFLPGSPENGALHRCYHTSVSSEDSELSSFYLTSYSSTCSNLTLTSTSTATSDCFRVYDPWAGPLSSSSATCGNAAGSELHGSRCECRRDLDLVPHSGSPYFEYFCRREPSGSPSTDFSSSLPSPAGPEAEYERDAVIVNLRDSERRMAGSKRSQFGRTKHPSVSVWTDEQSKPDSDRHFLCATWPPYTHRKYSYDETSTSERLDDNLDESVFTLDETPTDTPVKPEEIKETLGECSIPFKDLVVGECVRTGRKHQIHRGRWHGDVMIHTYSNQSEDAMTEFWSEVSKLSMIRHENIALFMGACLDSPNFAVITSVVKGRSLYEQLHLKSSKLSASVRLSISRQVAQGMGYLHARGIVIRNLNSKNVYLEPKVKLSIMDYGMAEKKHDRKAYGCVPRGTLCYLAPEMMRTLRVLSPGLEPTATHTKHTDVYAFGTILYETMTGQFPFAKMPAEVIIWQIGRGKRQSLKTLKVNSSLKTLIEKCWSRNPESRPTFPDINKELQFNAVLHKRHSSSNPEKLSSVGLTDRTPCMFP